MFSVFVLHIYPKRIDFSFKKAFHNLFLTFYEKAESLFAGSLADINSKLDQLVKGFADIQLEKQNSEEILDKRIEEKVKEVIFEEKEKEKRKLNLIAFHVPEAATGSTKMERMTHEQLYLNDILSELKVAAEIEDIVRLGKEVEGKARPLKFKVKTVEVKKEILSEAKELKNNGNETMCKVFICPDRTPKQREENRKLVAELKRRRNAGEEVQVGKDQEKAQSEKDSHSKNRGGKKPNQQSGTYTMKHIVSRMSSYFPNRWPPSYLNLTKNMKTHIRRQQHKNF